MPRDSFLDVFRRPGPGVLQSPAPGSEPVGSGDPALVEPSYVDIHGVPHGVHLPRYPVPSGPVVPEYNETYGTLRSRDSWRYIGDALAEGNVVAAAGPVLSAVTIAETVVGGFIGRTSQYPGGVQFFLVLHTFSAAPRLTTQTGTITWSFLDAVGSPRIPLGVGVASGAVIGVNLPKIGRTPITDAGVNLANLGNLQLTCGAGATFGTWDWQLGFSFAYLLPALDAYSRQGPGARRVEDEREHTYSHRSA